MKRFLSGALTIIIAASLLVSLCVVAGAISTTPSETVDVLFFGDSYVAGNDFGGMLYTMLENEGIEMRHRSSVWDNYYDGTVGKDWPGTGTFNLDEMFVTDSTDGSKVAEKKKDTTLTSSFWKAVEGDEPIEYFIWRCPTERIGKNSSWTRHKRQIDAFKKVMDELEANGHTNVKIILIVPQPTGIDGDLTWLESNSTTAYSVDEQRTFINNFLTSLNTAAAEKGADMTVIKMEEVINSFNSAYPTSDIELILPGGRYPTAEGTYLMSSIVSQKITGKSVYGSKDYCLLSEDVATTLQREAHKYEYGTYPTSATAGNNRVDGNLFPEYKNNSSLTAAQKALMAACEAFYNRGSMFQYDQWSMDKQTTSFQRRELRASPEIATPQWYHYLDCSGFVASAYYATFGYKFTSDVTWNMVDLTGIAVSGTHWRGSALSNPTGTSAATASASIKSKLQVGDVIVYLDDPDGDVSGHTMIYAGNNMFVHSTGMRRTGGNSDYSYTLQREKTEVCGTVRVDPTETFFDPSGSRYMFEDDYEVILLRPITKASLTATTNATTRLNNLQDIVSYKLTTAPYGQSVKPGQTVTFTFVIENRGSSSKTVAVSDTVPTGTTYKSNSGMSRSGTSLSASVTVPAHSTKQVSYTVTVNSSATAGAFITADKGKIGGIPCNETHIYVSNALTESQGDRIYTAASAITSATSAKNFANQVYKNAFGADFLSNYSSAAEILRYVFEIDDSKNADGTGFKMITASSAAKDMLVPGLIGGQDYRSDIGYDFKDPSGKEEKNKPSQANPSPAANAVLRVENPNLGNFMPGDILVYEVGSAFKSAIDENTGDTTKVRRIGNIQAELWVYCGNNIFMGYNDGKIQTLRGTAAQRLVDTLIGRRAFAVLRPAQDMDTSAFPGGINVWGFGGQSFVSYEMKETLIELISEGQGDVNFDGGWLSAGHDNTNTTYNLYELFAYDTTGELTGFATSVGATNAQTKLTTKSYDYIVIQTGRDNTMDTSHTSYTYDKSVKAAVKIAQEAYTMNNKVKIVLVAPYGHNYDFSVVSGLGVSDHKSHAALINAEAYRTKDAILKQTSVKNVEVVSIGDLFEEYAASKNADVSTLFRAHDDDGRGSTGTKSTANRANATGSYLMASAIYGAMFDTSPAGLGYAGADGAVVNTTVSNANELQQYAWNFVSREPIKVWFFGGHMAGSYNMFETLQNMICANQGDAEFTKYMPTHTSAWTTYNSWELFTEATRGNYANMTFSSASNEAGLSSGEYDYVIIQTGRDRSMDPDDVYYGYSINAITKLAETAAKNNPDVKIILVAPYGHGGDFSGDNFASVGITNHTTHTTYINDEAYRAKQNIINSGAAKNVEIVSIANLFESYGSDKLFRASGDGSTLTGRGNTSNRANAEGAYLTACAIYGKMFDAPASELVSVGYYNSEADARLSLAKATALRTAADSFIAKQSPSIWIFGGHMLGSYNMRESLLEMLNEKYLGEVTMSGGWLSGGHTSTANTYNAWELFAEAARNSYTDMTFASPAFETQLNRSYDYVIIQTGRDASMNWSGDYYEYNVASAYKIAKKALSVNPNAKIIILAPYGHNADFTGLTDPKINSHSMHTVYINAEANRAADKIKADFPEANVVVASMGTMFEKYASSAGVKVSTLFRASDGVEGMINVGNRANETGSYMVASALYQIITGEGSKYLITNGDQSVEGGNYTYINSNKASLSDAVTAYLQKPGITALGEKASMNLTMIGEGSGDIGVNLYIQVTKELLEDQNATVTITSGNEQVGVYKISELPIDRNTKKVTVKTSVSAKNLGKNITATIENGAGKQSVYNYSAKYYSEQILKSGSNLELKNLIVAMLNMGAASQVYFNKEASDSANLVNTGLTDTQKDLVANLTTVGTAADRNFLIEDSKAVGITEHKAKILLGSQTVIRHTVTLAEGTDIASLTFKVNGEVLTPSKEKDGVYYVDIENIPAEKLRNKYTLVVSSANASYKVEYGVYTYLARMFDTYKNDGAQTALISLIKSIYLYGEAARAYFA